MKSSLKCSVLFLMVFINFSCNRTTEKSGEGKQISYGVELKKKTQSSRTEILSPEDELAGFTVPEGFVVELVASEEDGIINPIDLTFDDAGRLWTQTAKMYPLDPVSDIRWQDLQKLIEDPEVQRQNPNFKRILDLYQGKTKGEDQILILSGLEDKGDIKVDVWADGLAIPQSIFPYKNGSFVAQGSELFFLSDTDNDGKADQRTPMLTGFGYTDTHTMAHTMLRGPGNWIHFSHGALNKGEVSSLKSDAKVRIDYSKISRFSLDGRKIEVVNAGLNNIWGFQLRADGAWYGCEANDLGYSVVPMEVGTAYPGIGNERLKPYQPFMPAVHKFRVGGTGISGLAFADDANGSFPAEWKDVAFLANPITSKINAVRIIRNPDGSVSAEHLPDFLSSEDDWFRPVNMEFGPDGCLYIADWYNKIISHNEVPTTHPDRDKSHGRIWRVRHVSQKPRDIPNFYKLKSNDLVEYLKSPSLWAKRSAWHQICDRPIEETKSLAGQLIALASDTSQDEITRIMALWSLEGINHYDRSLMSALLASPLDKLRREAVRSLITFSPEVSELAHLLEKPAVDENPIVRSQVLRTLDQVNKANQATIDLLIAACKPPLKGNELGGAYERNFERYLARKALEIYPEQLINAFNSENVNKHPVSNLIWASQALPKTNSIPVFLSLWKKAGYKKLDESTFIIAADMLSDRGVFNAVKPVMENQKASYEHVSMALENLDIVKSDELTQLLSKSVEYLLTSGTDSLQNLGLEAVGKLEVPHMREKVVALVIDDSNEVTLRLVMLALDDGQASNKPILEKIANDKDLGIELRAMSLQKLARKNPNTSGAILDTWTDELSRAELQQVTQIVSGSMEGADLLKLSYAKGGLPASAFDISSAEKVYQSNTADKTGAGLLEEVKNLLEEEKKGFEAKLHKFMAIANKQSGDAAKGERLFQVCLQCHSVGDKGYDYAPALDGSAMRENEALLTAILDPDAAMETSYSVYRVTQKDGNSYEGYRIKQDDRGTTLGFMGGSQKFIAAKDIKSEGFIRGRSFMIRGLIDNYSDEQAADLLAYIRTLK